MDVQLAATFQSLAGPQVPPTPSTPTRKATAARPSALGWRGQRHGERSRAGEGGAAEPADLRLRKSSDRSRPNVLNFDRNAPIGYGAGQSNSSNWQTPTQILDARLFKISAQFDF